MPVLALLVTRATLGQKELTLLFYQVVQECVGFRTRKRVFCQVLSDALAGRVLLLLALVNPIAVAQLLQPCTLQQAEYVLVKVDSS